MNSKFRLLINIFLNSNFAKSAFKLSLKSLIAQLIPLLFYPILTRIYTPEDFGISATILSLVPILIILSTGGYENAILISDTKEESFSVIKYVLIRSVVILTFMEILLLFFSSYLSDKLGDLDYEKLLFLVPLISFFSIITIVYNEFMIYQNSFNQLGNFKIINSALVFLPKLFVNNFNFLQNGLLYGELIGRGAFALLSLRKFNKLKIYLFCKFSISEFKKISNKFIEFQKYSMPEQLISNFGGAAPLFVLSIYFSATDIGYFSIASSVLTAPITIFTLSIRDVFRQKANEEYKLNGTCSKTYLLILKFVFFFGLIGFLLIGLIFPTIVDIIFGDSWISISKFSLIQLPMFFLSFVSMSLSGVFVIANKVRLSLFWQLYYTSVTIAGLLIGIFIFNEFEYALYSLVIARCSAYLLYTYMSYNVAKGNINFTGTI